MIEHGPGGVLVGSDHNGNQYFEKKDAQVGEHCCVKEGTRSTCIPRCHNL
jgi:hypothetical protein